jgi:hydroxymethylpyrimidine/phosphomethylpyrimidine kinase
MNQHIFKILSIAGSDSGGGAGIQADLKTFAALGCFGMTAITAVTSQNSLGVHWVEQLSNKSIDTQIHAVMADFGADAVKVGMLGSVEVVECISQAIEEYQLKNIVLDPVLVATSGATLGDKSTSLAIAKHLFPKATLITPNLYEASMFLNRVIQTQSDMVIAGKELLGMGPAAVLVKGGHLDNPTELVDILVTKKNGEFLIQEFYHQKIDTKNSHGTGCTLSSAIACGLGSGKTLSEAVKNGIDFVQQALLHGSPLQLAHAHGPLWHAFDQYPQVD